MAYMRVYILYMYIYVYIAHVYIYTHNIGDIVCLKWDNTLDKSCCFQDFNTLDKKKNNSKK